MLFDHLYHLLFLFPMFRRAAMAKEVAKLKEESETLKQKIIRFVLYSCSLLCAYISLFCIHEF